MVFCNLHESRYAVLKGFRAPEPFNNALIRIQVVLCNGSPALDRFDSLACQDFYDYGTATPSSPAHHPHKVAFN